MPTAAVKARGNAKIEISTDDATYTQLPEHKSISFNGSGTTIDLDYHTRGDDMERLFDARDASIDYSGNFLVSSTPLGTLQTRFSGGLGIYVRVTWGTGTTKTRKFSAFITKMNEVAGDGVIEVSATFAANGAVTYA